MSNNQPTLRRKRLSNKNFDLKEEKVVIEKGLDNVELSDRRTKDFGVPMRPQEYELFMQVECAYKKELLAVGARVPRRSLGRAWLIERIKKEAGLRGIDVI